MDLEFRGEIGSELKPSLYSKAQPSKLCRLHGR